MFYVRIFENIRECIINIRKSNKNRCNFKYNIVIYTYRNYGVDYFRFCIRKKHLSQRALQ